MQIVNVANGGTLHQDIGCPGTPHPPISDDPDEVLVLEAVPDVDLDGGLGVGRPRIVQHLVDLPQEHEQLLALGGRYRTLHDKQYQLESDRFINPGEDFTTPQPVAVIANASTPRSTCGHQSSIRRRMSSSPSAW